MCNMPFPLSNPSETDNVPSGLSEDEYAYFQKASGKTKKDKPKGKPPVKVPKDKTISSEENEMVSLVKYNETVEDYKTRISKLNEKIEEQKKTISQLREQKDAAENKVEQLKKEREGTVEDLQGKQSEVNEYAEELRTLKREKADLEKEMKTIREDAQKDLLEDLQKSHDSIEVLRSERDVYQQRIIVLEQNLSALRADNVELSKKLEEASKSRPAVKMDEPDTAGIIRREGPTEFYSSLFISPKYNVSISKSGSYIVFDPNVLGNTACVDHRLSIPSLDRYVPYTGAREHSAVRKGSKLYIYLQTASR